MPDHNCFLGFVETCQWGVRARSEKWIRRTLGESILNYSAIDQMAALFGLCGACSDREHFLQWFMVDKGDNGFSFITSHC